MSEADAIDRVEAPVTVERIAADLRDLGVEAGDTLLVHSSLRELGWVAVDPTAVVDALQRVVTAEGILAMPTHSGQYGNPAHWQNPPVPDDWVESVREERAPFRPDVTPTRSMGAVPECFRNYPGVVRSRHPETSFAAWGDDSEAVVADHPYDDLMGEESPLGALYERDADVLMLGTGWGTCTSLHLAEYRTDLETGTFWNAAPVVEDGDRTLVEYEDIVVTDEDFPEVGEAFEDAHPDGVVTGEVGDATAKLVDQRALVDFATEWFSEHR